MTNTTKTKTRPECRAKVSHPPHYMHLTRCSNGGTTIIVYQGRNIRVCGTHARVYMRWSAQGNAEEMARSHWRWRDLNVVLPELVCRLSREHGAHAFIRDSVTYQCPGNHERTETDG